MPHLLVGDPGGSFLQQAVAGLQDGLGPGVLVGTQNAIARQIDVGRVYVACWSIGLRVAQDFLDVGPRLCHIALRHERAGQAS